MRTIYKYALDVIDEQAIEMPHGAKVLCVQVQSGMPYLWAEVDTEAPMTTQRFFTYGTGHPLDNYRGGAGFHNYVGTYQIQGGALVFHVYQL